MSVRSLLAVTLFCTFVLPVQSARSQRPTGNELLDWCHENQSTYKDGLCLGFIEGLAEVAAELKLMCAPADHVTRQQIRDVVVHSLESDPAERQIAAKSLVLKALQAAFPCPPGATSR